MSEHPSQALEKLHAEAGVRRTLARYCHNIDDGDFEALAGCFIPDAELEAFGQTRNGREAVTKLLAKVMTPEARGTHLTVNTLVSDLTDGPDGARRASVRSDFLFIGPNNSLICGRYEDEFVQTDGGWLIANRAITIKG